MIPGAKEPEEGGLEDDLEYEPETREPEAGPSPDLQGEEGGGGAYGRPREADDEDEG